MFSVHPPSSSPKTSRFAVPPSVSDRRDVGGVLKQMEAQGETADDAKPSVTPTLSHWKNIFNSTTTQRFLSLGW